VLELRQEISYLTSKAGVLEEELQLLRHKLFGRRSERFTVEDRRQSSLFDEAELTEQEQLEPSEPTIQVAAHRRAKRGRKPLPAGLPRQDVVHDIPEEQKVCSCGQKLV
jgi:transposase